MSHQGSDRGKPKGDSKGLQMPEGSNLITPLGFKSPSLHSFPNIFVPSLSGAQSAQGCALFFCAFLLLDKSGFVYIAEFLIKILVKMPIDSALFSCARARKQREIPVYHTPQILSSDFEKKVAQIFIPQFCIFCLLTTKVK